MSEVTVKKRVFVMSWILLMLLTFALLAVGTSTLPVEKRDILIVVMMLIQAYLVSFYFMHLRFEKGALAFTVVSGILVTATLLFGAICWDGLRIIRLSH